MIPEDLRYSSDHEWIRTLQGEGHADTTDTDGITVARVGITDYAQNSLGDIVFVQMPEPGTTVELVEASKAKSVLRVIDALEEHDDVQNVYANFDIPDDVMAAAYA